MSMLSKLTILAKKAINDKGSRNVSRGSGRTGWRAIVRSAADAVTGDSGTRKTGAAVTRSGETSPHGPDARGVRTSSPSADPRTRAELPAQERPGSSEVDDLARAASRTEAVRPGFMRGLLARAGGGAGGGADGGAGIGRGALFGGAVAGAGLAAGGILAAVAGGAIISSTAGPLLDEAASLGLDFEALAGGIDLTGIAGGIGLEGLSGSVDGLEAAVAESAGGVGEQISGLGDRISELGSQFTIPGLGDLFGR